MIKLFKSNKITMRPMELSDLESIKDGFEEKFESSWGYKTFENELINNSFGYTLLIYKDEIICIGGIKKIEDQAELMNIVTRKDMRGKGFGKLLLNEIVYRAKKQKCKLINLEVNSNNKPAISLYRSLGFVEVGLRKKYYNNTDNAILMTLNINN